MNILVTGAKGMVGTALCANLKNLRDGKNRTRPRLHIDEIYEYDLASTPAELEGRYALFEGSDWQMGRPSFTAAFRFWRCSIPVLRG